MEFCVCFDLFNKFIKAMSHNPSKYLLFEIHQMLGRIFLYDQKIIQVKKFIYSFRKFKFFLMLNF